jgi:hypothetical protein
MNIKIMIIQDIMVDMWQIYTNTGGYMGDTNIFDMKTKELGWKENHGIQNIGIEDSQGNIIINQRRELQIWENYITELYDLANRPEHLDVEPEEEVDEDEKGPYILQSEVEKAIKEMRDKKATGDDDLPGDVLKFLGEGGLTNDTDDQQHVCNWRVAQRFH